MTRLLCLVGVAWLTPSTGIRKTKTNTTEVSTAEISTRDDACAALGSIVVNGKAFGEGFELLCKVWPGALGDFPISDVTRGTDLVNKALEPGGTWDQIKAIRVDRADRGFCWRNKTVRTLVEKDCSMESGGECYGACPIGFKPAFLSGLFRPTCTSACGATNHPRPCGFGCASGWGSCANSVLEQVGAVVNGVGNAYSYLTGDDRITTLVDAVVSFAEFIFGVLPTVLDAVKKGIDTVKSREESALMVVVLFQYIEEIAPEIGETVESIRVAFKQLSDTIVDVMEEKHETGSISVGRVVRGILDHGELTLGYAVKMTKVFSHPTCSLSIDDAVFVVEQAGDEDFVGPYVERGTHFGRPLYSLKTNSNIKVQYDDDCLEFGSSCGAWRFSKKKWYTSPSFHYLNAWRSPTYPLAGWSSLGSPEPIPEIVPMKFRSKEEEEVEEVVA